MKKLLLAAVACAFVAGSAQADIAILPGRLAPPDEKILFDGGVLDNQILGVTTLTSTGLRLTSEVDLIHPVDWRNRVRAAKGGFTTLAFELTDPTLGFEQLKFNINAAETSSIIVRAFDQFGTTFQENLIIHALGSNWLNFFASNNQLITRVEFESDAAVYDVRQFSIGGIGLIGVVPEPEAWAMMILGFAAVGMAIRCSRRRPLAPVT